MKEKLKPRKPQEKASVSHERYKQIISTTFSSNFYQSTLPNPLDDPTVYTNDLVTDTSATLSPDNCKTQQKQIPFLVALYL